MAEDLLVGGADAFFARFHLAVDALVLVEVEEDYGGSGFFGSSANVVVHVQEWRHRFYLVQQVLIFYFSTKFSRKIRIKNTKSNPRSPIPIPKFSHKL